MGKEGIPVERIARAILVIHGEKVMLDSDLAALYRVTTGKLNKAVKRNAERFPTDFMFQLDAEGSCKLEIPIWNIKLGRASTAAIRLRRTRRRDAFEHIK